jgi:hypothetical protein
MRDANAGRETAEVCAEKREWKSPMVRSLISEKQDFGSLYFFGSTCDAVTRKYFDSLAWRKREGRLSIILDI